ncbi:DUF2147 domain-containing protein [Lentibacter sp. XHP0401]|uniref:DUF2147 domain-containing protein n=1 Tax=Lentibacter sp. XHP0401 TaxID=2984334 RepID=UPI0021E7D04A|nr:DUF2147 domain-containing protein [Lentibacter sp. XHP0401]MCV2893331.1 DUF2147 domain-containing protein [Lentibacter sp. XHP0401]
MKKTLILAVAGFWAAGAVVAEPALGMWKTEVDDGSYAHVQMSKCGANVCGTIAKSFNASGEYNSPNKGKQIVRGMTPKGGGAYEGKVWRPSNDKIYIGKMQVNGNNLTLKGCVAGGLLCSSQKWTKIK